MWRKKTRVAEERSIEVGCASDKLEALDLHILRILEEAGAGQSLSHACRGTDDFAIMLIGSGAATFLEFDRSLQRLEAEGMISLDEKGFARLGERGRDQISPHGPRVQETTSRSTPVPAVA
jgi:hypothetical protein